MQRTKRSFLKFLGISPLLPVALTAKEAVAQTVTADPKPFKKEEDVYLGKSKIAGAQYYENKEFLDLIPIGATLDLARNPKNPYDAGAIKVEYQGKQIGHVPRVDNTLAFQMMDAGRTLYAVVVNNRKNKPSWERFEINLFLKL